MLISFVISRSREGGAWKAAPERRQGKRKPVILRPLTPRQVGTVSRGRGALLPRRLGPPIPHLLALQRASPPPSPPAGWVRSGPLSRAPALQPCVAPPEQTQLSAGARVPPPPPKSSGRGAEA